MAIHGKAFDPKHEELVWWTAKIMVESLFRVGHYVVILDATNITKASRDRWKNEMWDREFIIFQTSLTVCIERAKATNQSYLEEVIHRMHDQWEEPQFDEALKIWVPNDKQIGSEKEGSTGVV